MAHCCESLCRSHDFTTLKSERSLLKIDTRVRVDAGIEGFAYSIQLVLEVGGTGLHFVDQAESDGLI